MSKSATKKATSKKVAKAKSTLKRADGPVAKSWAIFDRVGLTKEGKAKEGIGTVELLAACDAEKIKRGTSQTQLGRWRKKNNIKVVRGGTKTPAEKPAAKKDKKEPAKKTPTPAKSAKKSGAPEQAKEKPKTPKKTRKKAQPASPTSDSTKAGPPEGTEVQSDGEKGSELQGADLTPGQDQGVTMGEVADTGTGSDPEPGSEG